MRFSPALVSVPSDNNCFFHAIAQLVNTRRPKCLHIDHHDVREEIVTESIVQEPILPCAAVLDSHMTAAKWRSKMRRAGEWGDALAMFVAAITYRLHLHVVTNVDWTNASNARVPFYVSEVYPPTLDMYKQCGLSMNSVDPVDYERATAPVRATRPVYLLLRGGHYSLLRVDRQPVRASRRLAEKRARETDDPVNGGRGRPCTATKYQR